MDPADSLPMGYHPAVVEGAFFLLIFENLLLAR